MWYILGRCFFFVFFSIFFSLKIEGRKYFPKSDGFLVASNHVSFFDPILLGVASPRSLNYMARNNLFKNPIFAWLLKKAHVFALKRQAADFGAMKEALRRIKAGGGLVLFPEGTRSASGELGKGLEGVGFLARKSGALIVPAYVSGAEKAWPKNAKFFRPAKIKVVFGEPFLPSLLKDVSDQALTQEVMRRIQILRDSTVTS